MPLSGIDRRGTPLPSKEKLPESDPALLGVNTTLAVTLCPAPRVNGVVSPVLKPVPVTVSCVMVAEAVPLLLIVTVFVVVVFSAKEPNARLVGVAVSIALPGVCGTGVGVGVGEGAGDVGEPPLDALNAPLPPQPINIKTPNIAMNR